MQVDNAVTTAPSPTPELERNRNGNLKVEIESNLASIEQSTSTVTPISYYNEAPFVPNSKYNSPNSSRPPSPIIPIKPRKYKVAGKGILKASSIQSSKFNLRSFISSTVGLPFEDASSSSYAGTLGSSSSSSGGGSGFWGNAIKKIAVAASEAAVEVSNRVIQEAGRLDRDRPSPGAEQPLNRAPNTPERGIPTSSFASTSSFATIVSPSSITPGPLETILPITDLKRVRFRMSNLKVIYPINTPKPPINEKQTRIRVNSELRLTRRNIVMEDDEFKGWRGINLLKLYHECCLTREELGIATITKLLKENPTSPPRVIDLSNEILSPGAIEALSDLLAVDFGLKKLILEGCGIDDQSIKPLLHSLLVSANIPTLSLASNKKIKVKAWKLIAIFIKKAKFLRYLDLSENMLEKRSADYIVQALTFSSGSATNSELAQSIPIVEDDAGVGIDEEEDSDSEEEDDLDIDPLFSRAPLLSEKASDETAGKLSSIRLENCGLKGQALEALAHGVRSSNLKHISLRRNRINMMGAVSLAIMIRDYPIISDSTTSIETPAIVQDVTTSSIEESKEVAIEPREDEVDVDKSIALAAGRERQLFLNSEVRNKLRKQIDELPRTGSLLTLDVKDNDIKGGIVYIAQVLKRNRTLKVLNLSENKIDHNGLVAIAEALKYNGCLETLDLSGNPCCGPSTDGITALRSSLTINTSLKRLFLPSTNFTTESAISLAEFLPEFKNLLHLDLTDNSIEIAGILAISVAVQMNSVIRCLDLNIAPNDPDFAHLSQDILSACIRNTELAESTSTKQIYKPHQKSKVKKHLESIAATATVLGEASDAEKIFVASNEIQKLLEEILSSFEESKEDLDPDLINLLHDLALQAELSEIQLTELLESKTLSNPSKFKQLSTKISRSIDLARTIFSPSPSSSTPPIAFSSTSNLASNENEVLLSSPSSEKLENQSNRLILEEGRSFRRGSVDGGNEVRESAKVEELAT